MHDSCAHVPHTIILFFFCVSQTSLPPLSLAGYLHHFFLLLANHYPTGVFISVIEDYYVKFIPMQR